MLTRMAAMHDNVDGVEPTLKKALISCKFQGVRHLTGGICQHAVLRYDGKTFHTAALADQAQSLVASGFSNSGIAIISRANGLSFVVRADVEAGLDLCQTLGNDGPSRQLSVRMILATARHNVSPGECMSPEQPPPSGPDLTAGVAPSQLVGGKLLGHVGDKEVLLVQSGNELFAIEAYCSHYHGPLVDGLVVGDSIRCPWHHACFSLRNGEAIRAPALTSLANWHVERKNGQIFVRKKAEKQRSPRSQRSAAPKNIVIV